MASRALGYLLIAAFLRVTPLAAQHPPGQPGHPGLVPSAPTLTTAARVASITVSPDSAVVEAGACQQFTAEARNPGGGIEAVAFTFAISNPNAFQGDGNGSVCANADLLESARTMVTVGVPGSQVTATAAFIARAARRPLAGKQMSPGREILHTPMPTGPTGTANSPIPDLTAGSIRPFEARVSWTPFVNATGYIVRRNGEIITGYEPYRGGSTYVDNGVSPGFHGYSVAASLTLPDGTKTGTSPRALTTTTVVVRGYPPHQVPWLSRSNGPGSEQDASRYYDAVGARPRKDTFDKWWDENAFDRSWPAELRATYFNSVDLEFGRDMHCKTFISILGDNPDHNWYSCWVANHGPEPGTAGFPNPTRALADAAAGTNPFATVAMEKRGNGEVTFYAFGRDGRLVTSAALDSDGPKFVPHACMACHGGTFDPATGNVSGASFLPFDVSTFRLRPDDPRGPQLHQDFANLNAFVKSTRPRSALVTDLIDGMQRSGDNYVPAGWAGKEDLYRQAIKPYCRTCHLAVRPDVIASAQHFLGMRAGLERVLCTIGSMPHAEVPFKKFWTSTNPYAPALLKAEAGISCGQ